MRNVVSWFNRQMKGQASPPPSMSVNGSFIRRLSASELLDTPRRKALVQNIWHRTSVNGDQFERLYMVPIRRYAELVQQLPASENHHHSYLGGMLDHGLEIMAYALKMRQSYVLPIGSTPEEQAAQSEAWSAAIAFAALLHDVGKIAVDVRVELSNGKVWRAWDGPINCDYRFQYVKGRQYKLHAAAAGLLYTRILPSQLLAWLSDYPDLWSSLLYVLAGQFEHAGVVGDIVVKSDQASVASELGGKPNRAASAPRNSLQKQLVEGLRYLIKNELRLNQPEASDGWVTADAVWLVSKTVSDRLRAHLLRQGVESIPDKNSTLFNVLQDNGIIIANQSGKAIWEAEVRSAVGWQHSFTFLRVAPALIWAAGEERISEFEGTVSVSSVNEASQPSEVVPEHDNAIPVESEVLEKREISVSDSENPASASPDEISELLDLLNINSGVESDDVSMAEPAVPELGLVDFDLPSPEIPPGERDSNVMSGSTLGHRFMHWIKTGVATHKIIINDAKAKVHSVDGTALLVTPEIFRRYAQEHPDEFGAGDAEQPWLQTQKSFEKLKLHRKRKNGHNIWTCQVHGPRKKTKSLKGYLMKEPLHVFSVEQLDNPNLKLDLEEDL